MSSVRVFSRFFVFVLISYAGLAQAEQIEFEWLTVGNPGNAADVTTGFGAVGHTFRIAKYEVTNQQYVEFLNAKAADDSLNLYSPSMGAAAGGITRSGLPGSYSYAPRPGREHRPVNWVSYYDVLRFSNWMHNGQGDGDTETGAYTLEASGPIVTNAETVRRNAEARYFLPTEDEWYKAAYHNGTGLQGTDYFLYPYRTDEVTTCSIPSDGTNHANCARSNADVIPIGSYPNSIGPYGTLDQGGNVWEWNVGFVRDVLPVMRGGGYYIGPTTLASDWRDQWAASGEFSFAGFRMAAPEAPSEPPAPPLRDRIVTVAEKLDAARDGNFRTEKILDDVLRRISQTVAWSYWRDSNNAVDKDGKVVFDGLRKSVNEIEKLLKYVDEADELYVEAIAATGELYQVSNALAFNLTSAFAAQTFSNADDIAAQKSAVDAAEDKLGEAEADRAADRIENAVVHCRSAWKIIDKAIREINYGYSE